MPRHHLVVTRTSDPLVEVQKVEPALALYRLEVDFGDPARILWCAPLDRADAILRRVRVVRIVEGDAMDVIRDSSPSRYSGRSAAGDLDDSGVGRSMSTHGKTGALNLSPEGSERMG